jgi:hypothetical protein
VLAPADSLIAASSGRDLVLRTRRRHDGADSSPTYTLISVRMPISPGNVDARLDGEADTRA